MVYSMTGTGEGRITENGFDISVFIKSVNHRFFHLQIRLPRGYQRYETVVREAISQSVSRGKIDVNIEFYSLPATIGEFVAHQGHAEKLAAFIRELADKLDIPDGLTAEKLAQFNDMFTTLPPKEQDGGLASMLQRTCEAAVSDLMKSRHAEGKQLSKDVLLRTHDIAKNVQRIREAAKNQPGIVRDKLRAAIQKIEGETQVSRERLEEEVLIWAVRSDITEEIIRIESHLKQIQALFDSGRSIGKELEFLVQELHREITTIGTKSVLMEINERVVPIKMEIEKLREQAQNLE
jgi:uncharacterized protein (TIGR00255 family)